MPTKWTEEVVVEELKKIIDEVGYLPGQTTLNKMKRFDVTHAIQRNGGMMKFREILNQPLKTKPPYYWNLETIDKEILKFLENSKLPEFDDLGKIFGFGFTDFVYRNKLTSYLCEKYGFSLKSRPNGFWTFERVKICLMEEFGNFINAGIFPTTQMIKASSYGTSFACAVASFGGVKKFAKELNCELRKRFLAPDGHFLDSMYELIFDLHLWSRDIKHDVHGQIGETNYKYDFKIADFYVEIWGLDINSKSKLCEGYVEKRKIKEEIYTQNNFKLISIEPSLFDNNSLKNIEKKLDILLEVHGFKTFKKREVKLETVAKSHFEETLDEIKVISKKLGFFPTADQLRKIGKAGPIKKMQRYGGPNKFRKILGYPIKQMGYCYWTKEQIMEDMQKIAENIGHSPLMKDIPKNLYSAIISKFGGLQKYRTYVNNIDGD